jgi:hypothetical protein
MFQCRRRFVPSYDITVTVSRLGSDKKREHPTFRALDSMMHVGHAAMVRSSEPKDLGGANCGSV